MSWLLAASPGHRQPRYWMCRVNGSLSYTKKKINYVRHLRNHCSDVIICAMASQITCSGTDKKNTKAPRCWSVWGEPIGDRWYPSQRASNAEMFLFDDVIKYRNPTSCVLLMRSKYCISKQINFCADVERMVWFHMFGCVLVAYHLTPHINIGLVCVYFEYTLFSSTWLSQNGFKSAHLGHQTFLNTRQHQFAGKVKKSLGFLKSKMTSTR